MPSTSPDPESIKEETGLSSIDDETRSSNFVNISDDEPKNENGTFRVGAASFQANLKTTEDGAITLIPQPSNDVNDPLNWTWSKKHLVLLSLFMPALLTDFGMTWGTTLFEAQAPLFHKTVAAMANTVSGGIFLQGPGGVLAVPFCERYGRLPILFWSQLLACMCVVGASKAESYALFTAFRTLQGFFNTAPQVIGLSIVGDLFFFHERAIRVNLWAFSFICGPFLDYAVLAGLYGLSLLGVILLGDETLYDRANPQRYPTGIIGKVQKLTGFAGTRTTGRPSLGSVAMRILRLAIRPEILAITAGFMMILCMWCIGIVTTISQFLLAPPYNFSHISFALFYLGPITGACIAEIWGHWFNDFLCNRYIKRHRGLYIPENRLWGAYPAGILGVTGLILFGQTLEHRLTWFGLCFGWSIYVFSLVTGTTAVSAYLLDSFPKDAALVSGILNFWRTTGGFCVSYFQLKWVVHNGAAVSFGCQAAILAASFPTIIVAQVWGWRWRAKGRVGSQEN